MQAGVIAMAHCDKLPFNGLLVVGNSTYGDEDRLLGRLDERLLLRFLAVDVGMSRIPGVT